MPTSRSRLGESATAARPAYAADRWARAVIQIINCPFDRRTVQAWAERVGASEGTLRARCRAAHVTAKASLDLGRLLRALKQAHEGDGWDPENLLDISEARTLHRLLERGGLLGVPLGSHPPIRAFFRRQRLVISPTALRALEDLLPLDLSGKLRAGARGGAAMLIMLTMMRQSGGDRHPDTVASGIAPRDVPGHHSCGKPWPPAGLKTRGTGDLAAFFPVAADLQSVRRNPRSTAEHAEIAEKSLGFLCALSVLCGKT